MSSGIFLFFMFKEVVIMVGPKNCFNVSFAELLIREAFLLRKSFFTRLRLVLEY